MKCNFKNFPNIILPYTDIQSCKKMMLRLYEGMPYLAELPQIDKNDNIIMRTFENIPAVQIKDKKFLMPSSDDKIFEEVLLKLDKTYSSENLELINCYSSTNAPFYELYIEMLKRFKPQYTTIKLLGPYTFADTVFNQNTATMITDKNYRKFIIQALSIKALWYINQIKLISPETTPIIIFDEQKISRFSTLKRQHEELSDETIITLIGKIVKRIKAAGAYVGIQSFEKCNWQTLINTDIDLISFNAYDNPNNLNIIAKSINTFLCKGGYINWAIIPTKSENLIKTLNIDIVENKFRSSLENLASEGVSLDLLYKHSTVSTLDNLENIPIIFAEKSLMLLDHLAKKLSVHSK